MGSNGPSQNVVSTMFTLHVHIYHVKTVTAEILPPPLSLSLYGTHLKLY